MDAWALAKATIALFVVVDPFGNIPIFIGILKGMGKDERGRALKVALVTGFVILMVLALTAN
ncbi:MAG: MarC family protein, partial [Thaumarchaeota archaeon]|nr:MarC family protein [Nitrososphaerota archaeon]